ncbi:MAG: CDP-alcohol phosphatidyltransferase family protein [Myxococcota bacterium]
MLKARFGHDFDARIERALPFLFHPRVHPNALSVAGLLVSIGGAWLFAQGRFREGALVVLLGGVFDLVDGVVARRQGRATPFGGFLDSSLDRVVDMALLIGPLMYYAREGQALLAWVAALALVATVMVSYTKARAESLLPHFEGGLLERAERVVILVAGGLFGAMPLALGIVAVGSTITAGQRIALAHRRLEELTASRQAELAASRQAELAESRQAELAASGEEEAADAAG